ncbi:MAG: hypothetical protein RIA65_14425, partial [Woeseia sp.]
MQQLFKEELDTPLRPSGGRQFVHSLRNALKRFARDTGRVSVNYSTLFLHRSPQELIVWHVADVTQDNIEVTIRDFANLRIEILTVARIAG